MRLRTKLFTAFFGLIILPIFLLGVTAYFFLSDLIEQKYSRQAELTLRALSQSVEFIFHEMNKVTDSTIASTAVQQVLDSRGYPSETDLTEIDYLALNDIQRNFRELLVNHPSVSYAFMYSLDGMRINKIYSKDRFNAMPFDVFKEQPLYREVLERNGLPKWVGPFESPQLTGLEPVFTQIRVVKDINTLDNKGILLTQIKNSGLQSLFRYFSFKQHVYQTRFFIVNERGLILFDSSDKAHGRQMNEFTEDSMDMGEGYQSGRVTFAGNDSILSSINFGDERWHLVSVASWSSLASEINQYSKWVAVIISFCLLSAFVFILFFVNRIAKHIIRIVRFMGRVESGEMNIRVPQSGKDELGLLSKGLNSLIERVQELLGRVKKEQEQKNKAEMRVLQAQIKPHFLFNTLESINALAVQNDGKKVSQMVLRLANILRISILGNEEITLKQEVDHLKSYLEIQQYRFAEVFDYIIDIPEELMSCTIQKLTLQPLVENCIQHGFDGLTRRGSIMIRAASSEGKLILTVEDNGIGISGEMLSRFQYMQADEEAAESSLTVNHMERRGLGVRSVADRIRIQYGDAYGLLICSSAGEGTIIQCKIPMYEYGEFRG
ncbi:histidine kinase [Paenibacillus swuensis]|uniref:histidine kinase n=1 Tax=Paenibacillus swuensis TaxID=1178515 RepID=A0A172TIQ8_9BACL|nr:sensor histidine kinase [Paenibacillus swuensis]ANE46949.1 histidine kinase [Paenibacillus swuensis]